MARKMLVCSFEDGFDKEIENLSFGLIADLAFFQERGNPFVLVSGLGTKTIGEKCSMIPYQYLIDCSTGDPRIFTKDDEEVERSHVFGKNTSPLVEAISTIALYEGVSVLGSDIYTLSGADADLELVTKYRGYTFANASEQAKSKSLGVVEDTVKVLELIHRDTTFKK